MKQITKLLALILAFSSGFIGISECLSDDSNKSRVTQQGWGTLINPFDDDEDHDFQGKCHHGSD